MGDQRDDAPHGQQEPQEPRDASTTGEFARAFQEYQDYVGSQHEQGNVPIGSSDEEITLPPVRSGVAIATMLAPIEAPAPQIDDLPTARLTAPPHFATGAASPMEAEAPSLHAQAALEAMATEPVNVVIQPAPAVDAGEVATPIAWSEMETERLAAPLMFNVAEAPSDALATKPEMRQPVTSHPIAEEPFGSIPTPWDEPRAAESSGSPQGDVSLADLPTVRMHTAPPLFTAPTEPSSAEPATAIDEETTLPPYGPRRQPTAPPTPWNAGAWAEHPAPAPPPAPPEPIVSPPPAPFGEQALGMTQGAPGWGRPPDQQGAPRWSSEPPTPAQAPRPRYPAPPVGYPSAGPMTAPDRTPVIQRPTPALPPTPPAPQVAPQSSPWRQATGAPPEMPPARTTRQQPPVAPGQSEAPLVERRRGASRVVIVALAVALVLASLGMGGAYLFGMQQAKAPTRAVTAYCAALTQANYQAAYQLLLPSYQASISQRQYLADQQLRDHLFGHVTSCSASLASQVGVFIFWRQPSFEVFDVTLRRAGAPAEKHAPATLHGEVTLAPNGATWLVGAVDLSLQSVDLDPLTAANGFCDAMIAHHYANAYSWLSPPYQQEQGGEPAFAQSFGVTLGITKCDAQPQTLVVSSNDRVATMLVTLTGYGAPPMTSQPVSFTLPADLTLVHLPAGWRIDTLTIPTPSGQN